MSSRDPEDDDDEEIELEPDDPDMWIDESEDVADLEDERADCNGWPVI